MAPFKAQNMSLQSYICQDGSEIGLAQAIQAMACGLEPEYTFNPILLKPEGNGKSQVIVKGRLYKRLTAKDYYKEKDSLWREVSETLRNLQERFELIIMEGAGSPAEINLLDVDLVNIKPPLFFRAPVIMVGDIDKGGAFASLYGTLELLKIFQRDYASLVKGYVINKFRGDLDILKPGLERFSALSGLPCLGVLPYFDISLSDEDGFSFFNKGHLQRREAAVKIVIVTLQHISNFSDFDPFYLEEDVELRYSLNEGDLLDADIIILPGSKNTLSDLKRLQDMDFKNLLKKAMERGAEIIGICGGFQMLGERLLNPYQIEGEERELEGLGLLDITTTFFPEKVTTQVKAKALSLFETREDLWGFEIHKGVSFGDMNLFEIQRLATGEILRDGRCQGRVWGTYLHGVFTNDALRRELINRHRQKKGLKPLEVKIRYKDAVDCSINRLAALVERHLRLEKVHEILGL